MEQLSWPNAGGADGPPEILWEDGERRFCRTSRSGADGIRRPCIAVVAVAEHPSRSCICRLNQEYALREHLDGAKALRPLDLLLQRGRPILVLVDPGGEPLERYVGEPMETGRFLRPLRSTSHPPCGRCTSAAWYTRTSSPLMSFVEDATSRVWPGLAASLTRRTTPAGAPNPDVLRHHRRHLRLHGAGADRTDEPVDRLPQRSLLARHFSTTRCSPGVCPSPPRSRSRWVYCHLAPPAGAADRAGRGRSPDDFPPSS